MKKLLQLSFLVMISFSLTNGAPYQPEIEQESFKLKKVVQEVPTTETITAEYNEDDQLYHYGNNTYEYDEDGFLSKKTTPEGITTYLYGTFGELKQVVTPTKVIHYMHNALNQRVAKMVNGQIVEKYLWEDLTTLLAVYDGLDNLVQRYEYADQRMPVAMTYAGLKFYLHYDQVGTLRAISDTSGNIAKVIEYDTFGNILRDTNPNFYIPFRFAGGLYDANTGLIRFGYRDYDSYTGRWTSKDPIGFDGGDSNLYGYVVNDPVNFYDANGLNRIRIPGRGGGGFGSSTGSTYPPYFPSSSGTGIGDAITEKLRELFNGCETDTNNDGCAEEWDAAYRFCDDIARRNAFRDGWSVGGRNYQQCLMGQVSERCKGNPVEYGNS